MRYRVGISDFTNFPKEFSKEYSNLNVDCNTPLEALEKVRKQYKIKSVIWEEHNQKISTFSQRITYYFKSDCGKFSGVVREED